MRIGLRCGLVVIAGALAGCLTPNPNLKMGDSETGDDASSGDPSGSPTSNPATGESQTDGTSATSTTDGPTTDDPDTTDTQTTETPDTDTTGPASCGSGNVCAPEVPGGGWAGPVIWAETPSSDEPPACPGEYPEPAFTAFDDLQAPPANCDCDCGAASGATCATLRLDYWETSTTCGGGADEEFTIQTNGNCNAGPAASTGRRWRVQDPGVTNGECAPIDTVDIPPLSWNSVSTVCGGAVAAEGECASGQACVPSPMDGFESRVCIWQEGNLECPAGDYGNRFIRHVSETDDRNCQACTCEDAEGDCTGSVVLRSSNDCSGATPTLVVSIGGSCSSNVGGSVSSASAGTLSVQNVSCQPSVGTAIGEAEPAEPYTLCCMSL